MMRTPAILLALLVTASASAQQSIIEVDDFVDPRQTGGRPVFISRLVIGGAYDSSLAFQPADQNVTFVHLTNSLYWRSFQIAYKRSELRGDTPPPPPPVRGQGNQFETSYSVETSPTPTSMNTLNLAWTWPVPSGGGFPVMLRTRATFNTQRFESVEQLSINQGPSQTRTSSYDDRTISIDSDTYLPVGRGIYGSIAYTSTTRDEVGSAFGRAFGTIRERHTERALTYTNRFPSFSIDKPKILIRPTLTVGGVSTGEGPALNVVNPAIEVFRHFRGANLHVVWSPQWREAGGQWKSTHQVALFLDRALFVKMF